MFNNFKHLIKLSSQIITKCEFQRSLQNDRIFSALRCVSFFKNQKQNFYTSPPCAGASAKLLELRKAQESSAKKTEIKDLFRSNLIKMRENGFFPTVNLPTTLFDGVPFTDIPIINVRVSRNNTILSLNDKGLTKVIRSCGMDGFKNSRKGTNMAAQASGISLGLRAVKRGYKTVRVVIKGLGPGRVSALKGIQLGGVKIISITDNTKYATSLRPRKQRRL